MSGGLFAWDAFHATALLKALGTSGILVNGFASLIVGYFLVVSFIGVFLGDQQYHKWLAKVVFALLVANIVLGGLFEVPFGGVNAYEKKSTAAKDKNSTISGQGDTEMVFDTSPGKGAAISTAVFPGTDNHVGTTKYNKATAQIAFETFAAASSGLMDGEFAEVADDNLCAAGGQIVDVTSNTQYQVGVKNGNKPTASAVTGSNFKAPGMNGLITYVYSAVSAVMADIRTANDYKLAVDRAQSVIDGIEKFSKFVALDSIATDEEVFAAAQATPMQEVTSPTTEFFPGSAVGYSQFVWRRVSNPDLAISGKVMDAQTLVSNSATGENRPAVGVQGTNTFHANAVAAGFDANAAGVKPEYFMRTHTDLFKKQCMSGAPDLRPGQVASRNDGLGALDPFKVLVTNPATGTPVALAGYKSAIEKMFTGNEPIAQFDNIIRKSFGAFDAALAGDVKGTITAANSVYKSYKNIDKLRQEIQTLTGTKTPTTWKGLLAQYDQILSTDSPQINANRGCFEMGRSIAQVASAVQQTQRGNSEYYTQYLNLSADPEFTNALVSEVLAYDLGENDDEDDLAFAVSDSNNAEGGPAGGTLGGVISSAVSHVLTKGAKTGVTSATKIKTNTPNAANLDQERDAELQKTEQGMSETAKQGIFGTGAAMAVAMKFAGKGLMQVIGGWFVKAAKLVLIGMPSIGIVMSYVMMYYGMIFATALGLAFMPLWGIFSIGKLFAGQTDDLGNTGMPIFPVIATTLSSAIIGVEALSLAVASTQVMGFFSEISNFFLNALVGAGAIALATLSFSDGMLIDPLPFFIAAMKPIGMMVGVGMIPAMFAKLMSASPYSPKLNGSEFGNMGSAVGDSYGAWSRAGAEGSKGYRDWLKDKGANGSVMNMMSYMSKGASATPQASTLQGKAAKTEAASG